MSIANQGPLLSCECFLGDILLNFHFLRFRNHRTTFIRVWIHSHEPRH